LRSHVPSVFTMFIVDVLWAWIIAGVSAGSGEKFCGETQESVLH